MKKIILLAAAALMVSVTTANARTGEEIYKAKCFICHANAVAGAPKFGDAAAWAPRIATGMDALMTTANNGRGAMPPKGTCMDCSPEELKSAVQYMIDKAQPEKDDDESENNEAESDKDQ